MNTDDIWAAVLAARAARKIGLPPGNLWEPGTVRRAVEMLKSMSRRDVEAELWFGWFGEGPCRS